MSVLNCDVAGCKNIMCSRFFNTDVEEDKPLSDSDDSDTYYIEIFPIK